jgi:hypothetical protein
MSGVRVVVEGATDRPVAQALLKASGLALDGEPIVTNGKTVLDQRIGNYNQAARRQPWLVLRDADRDGDDCPVILRRGLLAPSAESDGMCFRLAVRSVEAWLMADVKAFAGYFRVPLSKVPTEPESSNDAKGRLVDVCRSSKRRDVREGLVPRAGTRSKVGPEYAAFLIEFASDHWRPEAAAERAPSLAGALAAIEYRVSSGRWGELPSAPGSGFLAPKPEPGAETGTRRGSGRRGGAGGC